MKKQKMSVISVFKGEVRLTDERHTIGTNKKLVVDLINQEKNRSSLWGQGLFEIALETFIIHRIFSSISTKQINGLKNYKLLLEMINVLLL